MKKHYLFDFDGTLVDSMPTWAGMHIRALEDAGITVPENFVETITPLGNYRASEYTVSLGLDISLEDYLERLSKALYHEYTTHIVLKPHVKEILTKLKSEGIAVHVLTASPHLYVDPCLQRLGVYDLFEKVWTIDDFGMTKAQTEIYQEAANRLEAAIENCTMVDDNYTAIATAQKAGMQTLAVYDASSAASEEALSKLADRYIYDFKEVL
ncbi:MAG: HAD family phosphatase [Clostridia bacterium]|nr:HAD family phosphatase [Clostridia bacterium]